MFDDIVEWETRDFSCGDDGYIFPPHAPAVEGELAEGSVVVVEKKA